MKNFLIGIALVGSATAFAGGPSFHCSVTKSEIAGEMLQSMTTYPMTLKANPPFNSESFAQYHSEVILDEITFTAAEELSNGDINVEIQVADSVLGTRSDLRSPFMKADSVKNQKNIKLSRLGYNKGKFYYSVGCSNN